MRTRMMVRKRAGNCSALSAESLFRRIVEGLRRKYFFYCYGADGVFLYVSPSVRNILGYAPREFLGKFGTYLVPGPAAREVRRRIALSIKGVRQPPYEVEVYHKDGSVRPLEVLEIPVKEHGRVIAVEGLAKDMTRERRARESLVAHDREMTEQASLILRSSGDGIIGVDREGRLTFMNESAEKMLGWKLGELKGEKLHPAIHCRRADGSAYPEKDCPMRAALWSGRTSRVEKEVLWRRDGTSFPVSYSARPMLRKGECVGAVVTFRDITEQRRLEEMKEFLTHAIVHDLNNPLTSIMAGAELAAECPGGLPGCENRDHLDVVRAAAGEMKKMLSDILDISRLEQGKLRLKRGKIRPDSLAGGAVRAMDYAAKMAGRRLEAAVPGRLPRVAADAGLIRRVLENLIANALRYAPKETAVRISAAARGDRVEFFVTDRGPGVAPEHLDKVFDKYFQSEQASGGGRRGKGLGLAFCRLAVEAHGGRIRAENLRPKGFAVRFELPASADGARLARARGKK